MIVTTRFPDLPPGPETAANAGFRARFRAGWGRVDSIFLARASGVETSPLPSAWSFKAVLEGSADVWLGRRHVRLEPGRFLLVQPGRTYSVRIGAPATCFSLHFSPALVCQVAASHGLGWGDALDAASPGRTGRAEPLWREQVQREDDGELAWRLSRIRARVAGPAPGDHEEDFVELVSLLLARECRFGFRALSRLTAVRATTRDELVRRIGWATDFIEGHYRDPIGLAEMASAAHLSRFHFLRAFSELHAMTPADYLRRRRLEAARRALARGETGMPALLDASGFGSRWSLQRALRSPEDAPPSG